MGDDRADGDAPLRVVLIGDSLAFHNHEGRLPLDDPRLYPNVMADEIARCIGRPVDLHVSARAGRCTPQAWELVSKDPWFQQRVLAPADVVVLNFAGGDSVPVGVPTAVKDLIPKIPHAGMRRRVRSAYWRHHRTLTKATRGAMRTVRRAQTLELWPRIVDMVRFYSGGAPVVAATTQVTDADHHGNLDPHSRTARADLLRMAAERDVPVVDHWPTSVRHAARFNPVDGMHWDDDMHRTIGCELAALVVANLRPKRPLFADVTSD